MIARRRLLELFQQEDPAYAKLTKEEYKELYYAIKPHIPIKDARLNVATQRFLYYGAQKFDKFCIPTPYATTEDDFLNFKLFLASLWELEGANSINAPSLEIHKLKWEIYRKFNLCRLDEKQRNELDQYLTIVTSLGNPSISQIREKEHEFIQEQNKLIHLIQGASLGTLQSSITTRLPYKLTDEKTSISLCLQEVPIEVKITPHYLGSSDSFFNTNVNSTIEDSSATRWQNFYSDITITIYSIIDDSKWCPSLILTPTTTTTDNIDPSWNFLFQITYEILEKLWWYFKTQNFNTCKWNPTPKDIPYIQYIVRKEEEQIVYKVLANPANTYILHNNNSQEKHYDIKQLEDIRWSKKCYIYATIYSEVGLYQETIFWLNVSIEALIEDFIQSVITDKAQLEELLTGSAIFERAEEYLSRQFPAMKGMVQWPKDKSHLSVYTKIKRVIQYSKLPLSSKDFLAHYSQINSDRNVLFHGSPLKIQYEKIKKAFYSYNWLYDKMIPYIKE